MNREAAFLEAIAATPDDRHLRLVYADWLEDQGDARAGLIRVEEEMRLLPVWADRYWELKPRRNELRQSVPQQWRETLRYGVDYEPAFRDGIPDGWRERWRLIREFHERWRDIPLGDVGKHRDEIQALEQFLGGAIPPSVREWIAFHQDLEQYSPSMLRDRFIIEPVPGCEALSLLLQAEGDYYWAVREDDLDLDDPPVHGYWEGPVGFHHHERRAASVTDWVLGRVIWCARGHSGFSVEFPDGARLLRQLTEVFPPPVAFERALLFELPNLRVQLMGEHFSAEMRCPMQREQVPAFFWEYTRNGGGHGIFAEQSRQGQPVSEPAEDIPF
jgi:uncharacterized protein (TIGR02996 family)